MLNGLKSFAKSGYGIFVFGASVGLVFFVLFYGLAIVNPVNTDWIWHAATHDTAQHYLGWQFYRAGASGGIITGLAYPQGLSMVFMDVIPLLALTFKPFSAILPTNFQYFGLWGLLCYLLMGGLSAILLNKIWRQAVGSNSNWRPLFVAAGSLIFVASPVMMARSFYHPALAGQWIILLGLLLIIDSTKLRQWQFNLVWTIVLVVAILIHPYFLPMMGALLLLAIIRRWPRVTGTTAQRWLKTIISAIAPAVAALAIFAALGGFSLGSGSEVHDLEDKGFNLLSFVNPAGYSNIPAFANRSSSA